MVRLIRFGDQVDRAPLREIYCQAAYEKAQPFILGKCGELISKFGWKERYHRADTLVSLVSPPPLSQSLMLPKLLTECLVDSCSSNQALVPLFQKELLDAAGLIKMACPLADLFFTLQVLRPGALRIVDVSDKEEHAHIYPPPEWLTKNQGLVTNILGSATLFQSMLDAAIREIPEAEPRRAGPQEQRTREILPVKAEEVTKVDKGEPPMIVTITKAPL